MGNKFAARGSVTNVAAMDPTEHVRTALTKPKEPLGMLKDPRAFLHVQLAAFPDDYRKVA